MSHVIKEAKKRKAEKPTDVYHNPHKLIIQWPVSRAHLSSTKLLLA
jgi:hypothetical protein